MCLSISLTFPFFNVNPSHANSAHATVSLQQKCNVHPNLLHFRGSGVWSLWVSKAASKYFCWELDVLSHLNETGTPWTQDLGSFEDPALNVQTLGIVSFPCETHALLKDLSCIQSKVLQGHTRVTVSSSSEQSCTLSPLFCEVGGSLLFCNCFRKTNTVSATERATHRYAFVSQAAVLSSSTAPKPDWEPNRF